ncbi:MAG TPA: response regulator transcription factor [Terriglobia bacterium]|nr:response regulator transcription factor [Terriglobia bacterium]
MMILIADDDPIQTTLLSSCLKKKGYRVTVAFDAFQAWFAASRRTPDAIILDIQMPGGTGRAVLRQLKSDPKTKQVPVIVVSGSIDSNEQSEVFKLGACEFLQKPVDLSLLLSCIDRLVGVPA